MTLEMSVSGVKDAKDHTERIDSRSSSHFTSVHHPQTYVDIASAPFEKLRFDVDVWKMDVSTSEWICAVERLVQHLPPPVQTVVARLAVLCNQTFSSVSSMQKKSEVLTTNRTPPLWSPEDVKMFFETYSSLIEASLSAITNMETHLRELKRAYESCVIEESTTRYIETLEEENRGVDTSDTPVASRTDSAQSDMSWKESSENDKAYSAMTPTAVDQNKDKARRMHRVADTSFCCSLCQTSRTPQWRFLQAKRFCNACYMRIKRQLAAKGGALNQCAAF